MENNEFENISQEPELIPSLPEEGMTQPSGDPAVSGDNGEKVSPFADSPYEMPHRQTPQQEAWQRPYQDKPLQEAWQQPYQDIPQEAPPKPKKEKKPRSGKGWKIALCAVLMVAVVAGSCGITAALLNSRWESVAETYKIQVEDLQLRVQNAEAVANQAMSRIPSYVIQDGTAVVSTAPGAVYASNVQSVVLITCKVSGTNVFSMGISSGSGFIISEDGYVVTNSHVVEGATDVTVTTSAGKEYPAKVVGADATNDVAVLKMETEDKLPAVKIGSSSELLVGDQVVAIGNPLGDLTSTLTVGYVSAKDRDVTTDGTVINMIQTDAAINSGNSGGPLFNMKGEVVGITTAKYSGASSSGASIEGIGFAIPMDDVIPLVEDLVEFGYIKGAYLGVMVSDMDATTASYYSLPVGAYVQEVNKGSCAETAGLQSKDIIIGLGEYQVKSITDLTRALRSFSAGDTTQLRVFRSGREITLTITLDEKLQTTAETAEPDKGSMPQDGSYEEWFDYFSPFFGKGNG